MKLNYYGFITVFLIKIIDVITTIICLNIGAIELNPLGFNLFSISLSFGIFILLGLVNYWLRNDKIVVSLISILLIVFIVFGCYVIINNIKVYFILI